MSINPCMDSKERGLIWDKRGNDHGFSAEIIRPEFEFVSASDELCRFDFDIRISNLNQKFKKLKALDDES
jgi:hypothetical protein